MILREKVLECTQEFCNEYGLKREFTMITNTCSKLSLSNNLFKIVFFIDEMETFITIQLDFFDSQEKLIASETIQDEQKEIRQIRKKALRCWRKSTANRLFSQLVEAYLSALREKIEKQLGEK